VDLVLIDLFLCVFHPYGIYFLECFYAITNISPRWGCWVLVKVAGGVLILTGGVLKIQTFSFFIVLNKFRRNEILVENK
jgi:hypothetical protein